MGGENHRLLMNKTPIGLSVAAPSELFRKHRLPGAVKNAAPAVSQATAGFVRFEVLRRHHVPEQARDKAVGDRAQGFDQVHEQGGTTVFDGMKKSDTRIHARRRDPNLYFGKKKGVGKG